MEYKLRETVALRSWFFFSQIGCVHIQVNRACAFVRLKRIRVEEEKQIDGKKKNARENVRRERERTNQSKKKIKKSNFL